MKTSCGCSYFSKVFVNYALLQRAQFLLIPFFKKKKPFLDESWQICTRSILNAKDKE